MTKETISKKLVREVRMCNALIRNEQFTHAMGQNNNGGQQLKKVSKNTNIRVYIQFISSFSEITISQNMIIITLISAWLPCRVHSTW